MRRRHFKPEQINHMLRDDEDALTPGIVDLACEYGRYGCRRITALLHHHG